LPALHALQHAVGYLSEAALTAAASHLRVPGSEVYGVATHYPEFRMRAAGRHRVRVCTGVSCAVLGGGALLDAASTALAVRPGETRADGEVSLEPADCFFACSMAPMVEVDGRYHGRVTAADVANLARWYDGDHTATVQNPRVYASAASARTAGGTLAALIARARERRTALPALRLLVQVGTCGLAVGGDALLRAFRTAVGARRLAAHVIEGACNGMCYAAPTVEVVREEWPRVVVEGVEPDSVDRFLGVLTSEGADLAGAGFSGVVWTPTPWRGLVPVAEHPFWRHQERVLLARAGAMDPGDLDDALLSGAYGALARALDSRPEAVIAEVKASSLQGRGGAFFPTAVKWEACRSAAGEPKYLVMNAEEGEPGIFKDRHLLEADPHQALEGALLAAYAAGVTHAILYVHGEAELSADRLAAAVAQAREAGLVGRRVLGRDFHCEVEIRRGAGGFVLGEETALLESIEGRRALPRTRPPFPVESGLWGRPTIINNVETLSAIPSIVARGGAWFAALGTARAAGTKVFGLSGPILRPGVVEVQHGVTLRRLLEDIGGGRRDGGRLLGAVVGGPSGTIVPAHLFDVAMEPRERVSPGTGGIAALPASASVPDIVATLLGFNARESCGKCTPCREGTPRLLALIEELRRTGASSAARARELAETIQLASLCGLGQAAPLALLRALEEFPESFRSP
jgi:NADH:ubiquinone oxidoreductase subunit F (NADH-binding)/NADH:ubiquinone oxidoreductase subunit E